MPNDTKIVVWDVETTRLIDKANVRIDRMEVSVACAVIFDINDVKGEPHEIMDRAERRVFWHEEVYPKRGECLDRLADLLSECKLHVAFNGNKFDILVMHRHFSTSAAYKAACERLYDPYEDLVKSIGSFSLGSLLLANGIASKLGKGVDAPDLWVCEEYDKLEEYCVADVDRLARLVLQPSIRIPGYMMRLPMGTITMLLENMDMRAVSSLEGREAPLEAVEAT